MPHLRLADFELGTVLGVGTVGTIYDGKVLDHTDVHPAAAELRGRELAIKKLHPTVSQDKLIRGRFQREMVILERLQHDNIIGYYGGGSDGEQLFYVMQRVDGGTIKDLLEGSGPLDWQVVVDVARQICSALQCAHNHGVIHRDLKPGNLFLTKDAQVKLGDFGIARDQFSADLTHQGLTVGTHAYMAPEQITGDPNITGKVDLYALGCCLFEMLANRKVFLGENFAQLFEQHLRSDPVSIRSLVPEVPEELDAIIAQCLAKSPDDRPFNARSVQGVMLEIGEKHGLAGQARPTTGQTPSTSPPTTPTDFNHSDDSDVGAGSVTEKGRQLLEQRIHARLAVQERPPVSSAKVAVLLAIIILVVLIAAVANGPAK